MNDATSTAQEIQAHQDESLEDRLTTATVEEVITDTLNNLGLTAADQKVFADTSKAEAKDFNAKAATMVDDMVRTVAQQRVQLSQMTGRAAEIRLRQIERMEAQLNAVRPGVIDLSVCNNRQPQAGDFKFPGRAIPLINVARKRFRKAKWLMVDPQVIIDGALNLATAIPTINRDELRLRLAYYFANCNLIEDGMPLSVATRRLTTAAGTDRYLQSLPEGSVYDKEKVELVASALAAIQSFMYEAHRKERVAHEAELAKRTPRVSLFDSMPVRTAALNDKALLGGTRVFAEEAALAGYVKPTIDRSALTDKQAETLRLLDDNVVRVAQANNGTAIIDDVVVHEAS
jgi:hypothetical protein